MQNNAHETIPFSRPYLGREEEEAVIRVLRSGWLTTGKETIEFEKEFCEFLKNPDNHNGKNTEAGKSSGTGEELFCMAVNSATSGLHLALEASGIRAGDLVLIPSMTFTATAEVIRYLGAEAIFVDVAKDSFHMDPAALEHTLEKLEKGVSPYASGASQRGRAKAVIPVHYGGLPCDMEAILRIAEKYDLKVIEDAAHSFPSFVHDKTKSGPGRWAGLMGDVGVFSFYATKTISTGEGGMVVTRNKAIAERIRIMRSHGIDRSVWNRYTDTSASWYYEVVEPGFKYNIPDLLSALGRVQLRRAMDLLSMRQEIAGLFDAAFTSEVKAADVSVITIPAKGPGDARHLYPLRLNLEHLTIDRNQFAAKMQEHGIGISVHFIPLHIMPYYKERYSLKKDDLFETMKSYSRVISLPIWPGMNKTQISRVITVVKTLGSEYTR